MAPLPPAIQNWLFKRDLEDIRAAYDAAAISLVGKAEEIEADARKQLGMSPEDPWPERDDDDEFDAVGRLYDEAGENEEKFSRAEHIVRKAFLISLFHLWERYCNHRMKKRDYEPELVARWLFQTGRGHLAKELNHLRLTANCAKHGPGDSCEILQPLRPDLFPNIADPKRATDATLVVEIETVERTFDLLMRFADEEKIGRRAKVR